MDEQVYVKKLDKFGRIVLPAEWRKKFASESNLVALKIQGNKIIIEPIKGADITNFIDSLEVDVDPEAFEDYNKLKKKLLGESI